MSIKIQINGKFSKLDVDREMPILWVLRDVLGLTGTKFGCGKGLCGACTVHLDGEAIRSCITPIAEAVDKKITTIEGLSEDADHPVQRAWLKHSVPQCGYCQPGQIMNAVAFLSKNKKPTDSDINDEMSGNLCRCGTYERIKLAIKDASIGEA